MKTYKLSLFAQTPEGAFLPLASDEVLAHDAVEAEQFMIDRYWHDLLMDKPYVPIVEFDPMDDPEDM